MAHRTASQLVLRRRFERAIGVAAPFLDALLYVGDHVSRVAGRGDIAPEPPRRIGDTTRGRLPAPPARGGAARD